MHSRTKTGANTIRVGSYVNGRHIGNSWIYVYKKKKSNRLKLKTTQFNLKGELGDIRPFRLPFLFCYSMR